MAFNIGHVAVFVPIKRLGSLRAFTFLIAGDDKSKYPCGSLIDINMTRIMYNLWHVRPLR